MKYIFAFVCPPLAMLWSGKPIQSLAALGLIFLGYMTFSIGLGGILLAISIMWAMRVVGEVRARADINRFMTTYYASKPSRP